MSGENPPKSMTRPPFGMLNMLLLEVVSDFQLHPIEGSPTSSAMPSGAG